MDTRWQPRTAVLIHTFNFRTEPDWLRVMWGTQKESGRIPTAVAAALESGADLLFTFNGNLMTEDGRTEGQIIRSCLFERIEELPAFAKTLPVFQHFSSAEIRSRLEQIFKVYGEGRVNTEMEVVQALPICREQQIEMLISVSSWDHISRIGQLFGALWLDTDGPIPMVTTRPAMSLYSSEQPACVKNVAVLEPRVVQMLGPVSPRRLLNLATLGPDAIREVDAVLTKVGA